MFKEPSTGPNRFIKKVEIKESPVHGYGIFASEPILKHEIFESCPVIIFHKRILKDYVEFYGVESHLLEDYVFEWANGEVAIALGYGSLYNHSNQSNATFHMDPADPRIQFIAKRDIKTGEEIFTHYRHGQCDLEFDDLGTTYQPGPLFDLEKTRVQNGMFSIKDDS